MSPKGTTTPPPAELKGRVLSHLLPFGPSPSPSALASKAASARQGPPASDGFNSDGRKKFSIAAGANGHRQRAGWIRGIGGWNSDGIGESNRILPVLYQQVSACCVGVDGPIQ